MVNQTNKGGMYPEQVKHSSHSKSCLGTDRVPLHIFRASPNALCPKATPSTECKRSKYPGYHKTQHFVSYSSTKFHFLILNVTRQREQVSSVCLCLFPRAPKSPSAAVSLSTASPARKHRKICSVVLKTTFPNSFYKMSHYSECCRASVKVSEPLGRWGGQLTRASGLPQNSEP